VAEVVSLPPARAVETTKAVGADGVSFTYNEPTIWLEYVLDCARLAKESGLLTDLVTNGYMTDEAMRELATCIDAVRIDVKGTQASYDAITRGARADIVRRNAERARELGLHLEIVTNVIPGVSDAEDVLRPIAGWIAKALGPETPWHLTRFHPARQLLHLPPTPLGAIERGVDRALAGGLLFVYVGNVPGHGRESTWCPGCGSLLVRRTGRGVSEVRLSGSLCPDCGREIPITGEARVTEGGPVGPVRVV
jgi:pyruvate formate lyase activating enzyme